MRPKLIYVGPQLIARILLPFVGPKVAQATLDAALRLAGSRHGTLVPAYLLLIPHSLALEAPPQAREREQARPVLELIADLANRAGVRVDARVARGRTHRHALATLVQRERYDTLIVPARTSTSDGFEAADVAWLLENAPGEVLVLRPDAVVRAPRLSAAAT